MILDSEQDRQLLLEVIVKQNFSGAVVEQITELKYKIATATVVPTTMDKLIAKQKEVKQSGLEKGEEGVQKGKRKKGKELKSV